MCGRYANHVKAMHRWTKILADWPKDVETGYNVAPTQTIPVVTREGTQAMRWGLIPAWAKDEKIAYSTFNARLESAKEKPAFRHAWQKSQTCLIPALGYYEWRPEQGRKQPYFIHAADTDEPLVFAGLWEQRDDSFSCTMLTQPAIPENMAHLHPRMPVMLDLDQAESWLTEGPEQTDLQPKIPLYYHPVSTAVNNARNQGASLTEPLAL